MAENNIPAFPLFCQDQHSGHISKEDGMTLLDYFAGQVLPVLVNEKTYKGTIHPGDVALVASAAYTIAAAMLAERTKHINS